MKRTRKQVVKKTAVPVVRKKRKRNIAKKNAATKKKVATTKRKPVKRRKFTPVQRNAKRRTTARNSRTVRKVRRRNSELNAADMYEAFHGKPSESTTLLEITERYQDDVAELGRLISMHVRIPGEPQYTLLNNMGACKVCCTPDGGQLYFIGGHQKLDLHSMGFGDYLPKDHIMIGTLAQLTYHTRKGFHNFEPIDYFHRMGEHGGEEPVLNYDVLNERIFITGGTYQVRPEGIVH